MIADVDLSFNKYGKVKEHFKNIIGADLYPTKNAINEAKKNVTRRTSK